MTNEEILQLARECGMSERLTDFSFTTDELIAFANAIRNAALEEAAGLIDERAWKPHNAKVSGGGAFPPSA